MSKVKRVQITWYNTYGTYKKFVRPTVAKKLASEFSVKGWKYKIVDVD